MFQHFSIRHTFFRLIWLSVTILLLGGCAEDLSKLFSNINADSFNQTPTPISYTTAKPVSKEPIQKPKIINHPKSRVVYKHQPLTLSVKAQSSSPIQYQWYKNNLLIAGANQSTYHVPKSLSRDQGFYHVVLKNQQAEIRSLTAKVTYHVEPVVVYTNPYTTYTVKELQILKQPSPLSVDEGSSFSLMVSAESARKMSYQWYRNNVPIFGANKATFTVLNASSTDQGRYSVLVQDANKSIRSSTALVTVHDQLKAAVELSWDTPRMREDGSPLQDSEIQGYIIQYGRNLYNLEQSIEVAHQPINRFTLREIDPGLLYLRIATMDSAGFKGTFSKTISVWVN